MGMPERLLAPDERLVLSLHPHVKALLRPALVLLATGLVTGLLVGLVPERPGAGVARAVVLVAAAAALGQWVGRPFVAWFATLYVITDRRLVTRRGVLDRTGHDLPLSRVEDVRFTHRVLDRVLGCGTLAVRATGQGGVLLLDDVPRVEQVQRTLLRLAEPARRPGAPGARGLLDPDEDPDADDEDPDADFDDLLLPDDDLDEFDEGGDLDDDAGRGWVAARPVDAHVGGGGRRLMSTLVLGRRRPRGGEEDPVWIEDDDPDDDPDDAEPTPRRRWAGRRGR